jgi:plastocyanin
MNTQVKNSHIFARQPLRTPGKLTIVGLLGCAAGSVGLSILAGEPIMPLLIIAVCLMIGAGIVGIGLHWTPLLGSILNGSILVASTIFTSYMIYHLTHPVEFSFFIASVLIWAFGLLAVGAGIVATVQNYHPIGHYTSRWSTSMLSGLIGMALGALLIGILIAATTQPSAASTSTNGEPTVHMGPGSFTQSSVTVAKGSKLLIVDDGSFLHILRNGMWVANNTPKPVAEPGAPTVNNVTVNGNSIEIGPFTTAGTYHIYCTVHPGMTLTVLVQ